MGLETTATYIDSLVITNPVGASDVPLSADEHLRLIKAALKRTFPGVNAAVTTTSVAFNAAPGAVFRGTATNISATYSFQRARPKWRANGVAYAIGGHYGITVDVSGTAISPPLLAWSSQLINDSYVVGFPSIVDRTRFVVSVTPNRPGLLCAVSALPEVEGAGVFSYTFTDRAGTPQKSRASVLVSAY
jgi:hypothetical protein